MYFHLSVSLLLLYLLSIEAEPCITPSGEQGECVPIDDCPALANAFANPISGTEELLRNFSCSYFITVCCISGWTSTNYGKEVSDRRYCGFQHTDDYFPTGNTTENTASIDEFPWLAALVMTNQDNGEDVFTCHGSLINNRYILTAAHCVKEYNPKYKLSKVLLGKFSGENATYCVDHEVYGNECTEVQEFGVEEKIMHPFYAHSVGLWNIALIRLNKTISYTDYIRPICFPTQGTKSPEAGEILYQTGWGGKKTYVPAPIKTKIKTVLLSSEECHKRDSITTSTYHICTLNVKNTRKFPCNRDVGAPVMYSYRNQWQIEGIVPIGSTCGADYPELHTRVAPYIDWIRQNIRP